MYADLVQFDGPRAPELNAASERAGRGRIMPAVLADAAVAADHVCTYALQAPDGGQTIITIANTAQCLDRIRDIVMGGELLPDEDPALLPDPDRVERLAVVYAAAHGEVAPS